eukprot:3386789-Ditylum_brightwellii.AAC.1
MDLLDCGEPVAKTNKVKDFMDRISDLHLDTTNKVVLGDDKKLNSFEECQQYFAKVAGLDSKLFIPNDKLYALEPAVCDKIIWLREADAKWKPSRKGKERGGEGKGGARSEEGKGQGQKKGQGKGWHKGTKGTDFCHRIQDRAN